MTKIVEITQPTDSVTCDKNGKASINFSMTNITNRPIRVGAKVTVEGSTQASWLKPKGGPEWDLKENALDQIGVQIDAKNADPGQYTFRLLVYSTVEPGEHFTESETVSFEIPAKAGPTPEPKKPFPWWIPVALVGVLLIVGAGLLIWKLVPQSPGTDVTVQTVALVPDVQGKHHEEAKVELQKLGFSQIELEPRFDISKAPGTVLDQSPPKGEKANPGETTITLIVADAITTVPDVMDNTLDGAKKKLTEKGFVNIQTEPRFDLSKPAGTVLEQIPSAGTEHQASETVITLVIADAGVEVPNLKGKNITDALKALQRIDLGIGDVTSKPDKNKKENTILDQKPAYKQRVDKGTAVTLVVAAQQKLAFPLLITQLPAFAIKTKCAAEVQGKIAWNYKGNKTWAPSNINRLCKGSESSVQPARCFQKVMHGGISNGTGTKWQWANAVDLCEGSQNASATISCFQKLIQRKSSMQTAIKKCGK